MAPGWSITVYRGGRIEDLGTLTYIPIVEGGVSLHRIPFTPDLDAIMPYRNAATYVINDNGYPCLYSLKACALPFAVAHIPADELVYVEAWDQS